MNCPECNHLLQAIPGIGDVCPNPFCKVSDDANLWDGNGNRKESPVKFKHISDYDKGYNQALNDAALLAETKYTDEYSSHYRLAGVGIGLAIREMKK